MPPLPAVTLLIGGGCGMPLGGENSQRTHPRASPRAGAHWLQDRAGRLEGSQQAHLLSLKEQVLSGSTRDMGRWRCCGLGHLLPSLLQHDMT